MLIQTALDFLSQVGQQVAPGGKSPNTFHISQASMMAGSPFTEYTAKVLMYGLLVAFLVMFLLIGAFLVVNVGLMSKRDEDRVGGRTPSDVGILKHELWPEQREIQIVLPAEEDDYIDRNTPPAAATPKRAA